MKVFEAQERVSMHQPVCLSVCPSLSHSHMGASRGGGMADTQWAHSDTRHLRGVTFGDTESLAIRGPREHLEFSCSITRSWYCQPRDSQAQGSIQEFRIEVSKLHVDVGFWITPCLGYQQDSGLCVWLAQLRVCLLEVGSLQKGRKVSQRKARIVTASREGAYLWSLPSL